MVYAFEILPMEDKDADVSHAWYGYPGQYHGYWCPGDARSITGTFTKDHAFEILPMEDKDADVSHAWYGYLGQYHVYWCPGDARSITGTFTKDQ